MFSIDAKSKGRVHVDSSRDVLLRHEHFVEKSWSGFKKGDITVVGCTFERCDFTKIAPSQFSPGSGGEPSRYIGCKFDGSRLRKILGGQSRFEDCSFLDIEIVGLLGHATEFVNCAFSGTLRDIVFFGKVSGYDQNLTTRALNEFRGNNFELAKFFDVSFRQGIDLSLQHLPVGDDYVYIDPAETALFALRKKYLQAPYSERREQVFKFLKRCEEQVRDGQVGLFLCKDSYPSTSRDTLDLVWKELRESSVSVENS